ncbi:glycosyltransferase family 4 protein [Lactovum miscens]|uniref:1,2-diacylglycerol-3-alpha-glucose alpha-1,2-galactosyltransferase n=1 Tax=Lactovum miscens TaxID=190387 RepID=A0A841C6C5_9LACT|nr:glycosyltransferase family 4 protein [Lactovum miscens]MBB5887827.1 1,2-diacylglycerol-3-alpha-glucose alpha-1,2-galactosyltransferase [Lactovum miscens]
MTSNKKSKITINMMSSADKIAGQGVGSAYRELIRLLRTYNSETLDLTINKIFAKADITHYHTVDFLFYLQSFLSKKHIGRRIGYVHFLPETLDGSIMLPLPLFWIFKAYVKSFYRRMDQLVVVNPDFKQKLIDIGMEPERVSYIPNFVAKEQFYEIPIDEKPVIRKKYNIPDNRFLVVGTGQIQYRKGIDDFVALAKRNPDITFLWAGGFSFGRITGNYKHYKELVNNHPQNCIFTGIVSRDEIRSLCNIADLFLLPSYDELFPMSILEAASCGAPIMLRDLDLYHNILSEKYIPCQDIEEMDAQLKKVSKDRSLLKHFKEMSKDVAATYSEESLTKIWEDFYKEQAELVKY